MYTQPDYNEIDFNVDAERRINELHRMINETRWWQWVKRDKMRAEARFLDACLDYRFRGMK